MRGHASVRPTLSHGDLRRAPSPVALATLCAAILPGGHVGRVQRLRGGISSGMHAVDLVGVGGERQSVVVRRYGKWRLDHDPRVGEREWAVLVVLARGGVPAPRPIWHDDTGAVFGCSTLVTSLLPGRGTLAPRDLDGYVRQLAETLAQIHATPIDGIAEGLLVDQRDALADFLERDVPPADLALIPSFSEVWTMLRRWWPQIQREMAAEPPTLVHGDYWPGNTLWRYGRLTGVVDWEQARRSSLAQDVGGCRLDLAFLFGPESADAFLHAYEAASGRRLRSLSFWDLHQSTWALESVDRWIDGYHDLGRTDVALDVTRARLDRFVTQALARAGACARGGGTGTA